MPASATLVSNGGLAFMHPGARIGPVPSSLNAQTVIPVRYERRLAELGPALHRLRSRPTGFSTDGEDIAEEAPAKTVAPRRTGRIEDADQWKFRTAHDAAVDLLLRPGRWETGMSDNDLDRAMNGAAAATERCAASASPKMFMQLPVAQRACTILVDLLGYSIEEVGYIASLTVQAAKAALDGGRMKLKVLARLKDDQVAPQLSRSDLARLSAYVDRFNARDFDAVRQMLAEDVRLELVARGQTRGRSSVSHYFTNYASVDDWHLVPGLVDGHPALLVIDPQDPSCRPSYFVLLEFDGPRVKAIRDFRHARYVAESADFIPFGSHSGSS